MAATLAKHFWAKAVDFFKKYNLIFLVQIWKEKKKDCLQDTPIQNGFQYKKQEATRIFSKAKTLFFFYLSLDIRDNPIYPFWEAHG